MILAVDCREFVPGRVTGIGRFLRVLLGEIAHSRPDLETVALAGLAALVKVRRISLIHVNAIGRVPVYASLVGRRRRVPVIWHVRVMESEGWKDRLLALLATRIVANAEAVVTLLEDAPHAHRLGIAGRRRTETLFSLSRHVEAVETLYREVLGTQHGIL